MYFDKEMPVLYIEVLCNEVYNVYHQQRMLLHLIFNEKKDQQIYDNCAMMSKTHR